MNKYTRKLTISALMTAVSLIFIYLSQLLPTMKLGIIAVAGIAAAVIVIEAGPLYGSIAWVATSILAVLFAPITGWLYVFFFGWYPSLKCLIERINKKIIEYLIKVSIFYTAFLLLYFILPKVLTAILPNFITIFILLSFICVAAFVIYDFFLSKFISFYLKTVYSKIR